MIIEDLTALRSLRNEAERQTDFFSRRNEPAIAEMWAELATIATIALTRQNGPWEIIVREKVQSLITIKACE